ncbi:MAG: hypothetical protein LQ349_009139, partial [Xanthoria aureola]
PKIYYLGAANVVNFGPLRIVGLSGIWSGPDYRKPHSERLPYDFKELKSIYHQRELDVRKLLQLRTQVDVGISHDWPRKVEWQGDYQQLFRFKPHFESDATTGRLGSPAARYVMDRLRPKWWFAAHLHCKFSAVVDHDRVTDTTSGENPEILHSAKAIKLESKIGQSPEEETFTSPANVRNDDEIDLDMEDVEPCAAQPAMVRSAANSVSQEDFTESNGVPIDLRAQLPASFARPTPAGAAAAPSMAHPRAIGNDRTHFLALDKCLPNRRFLQMLEIDPISNSSATARNTPYRFTYDKEWLAITRAFASINPLTSPIPPDEGESHYRTLIETEEAWIEKNLVEADKMVIPENFEMTAPIYDPSVVRKIGRREDPRLLLQTATAVEEGVGVEEEAEEGDLEAEGRGEGEEGVTDKMGMKHDSKVQ